MKRERKFTYSEAVEFLAPEKKITSGSDKPEHFGLLILELLFIILVFIGIPVFLITVF